MREPDAQEQWWCVTCESWRHTAPCGRDECPHPDDEPPRDDSLAAKQWAKQCGQYRLQRDELLAALKEALEIMWGDADVQVVAFRNRARAVIAKMEPRG